MLQSVGLAFVLGWAPLPSAIVSQFADVKGTGWGRGGSLLDRSFST